MARLTLSRAGEDGLRRVGHGRGFSYVDHAGRPMRDPTVRERIHRLAIPPAWTDVWICESPDGHIQATGLDADGRRQYLYHVKWRERMDRRKHERALDLAEALPAARTRVTKALRSRGVTRARALALSFRLLDTGAFRVGSEEYATNDGSVGLATLRCEHVQLHGADAEFEFVAKGGLARTVTITDPEVVRALRPLVGRRGEDLLAWRSGGKWRDVRSEDVNDYVREVTGGDFTAKDFRTWRATVVAAAALARQDPAPTETAARRAIRAAMEEVAAMLGNTPAIARKSYVDPRVLDRYRAGEPIGLEAGGVEAAVRKLLRPH